MKTDKGAPKWGLVIQGPMTSYGSGPNISKAGFHCLSTIEKNLSHSKFFEKIVLSTWKGEDFEGRVGLATRSVENLSLIANNPPRWDPDNRRKQWLSTLYGVQALAEAKVTHVLKIRTDQYLPVKLIEWITCKKTSRSLNAGKLLASEFLNHELFYAGDFFMAGTLERMTKFAESAGSTASVYHPSVVMDSVLKYLKNEDPNFSRVFPSLFPPAASLIALHPLNLQRYWESARNQFFIFPKRQDFIAVEWRGNSMEMAIPTNAFGFMEDLEECLSPRPLASSDFRKAHLSSLRWGWARYSRTSLRGIMAVILRSRSPIQRVLKRLGN